MFGFKKRSGPSHFNKPPTREEFEESLRLYFEQVDKYAHRRGSEWVDTFGKLKNKIGGVWEVIIDDMHKQHAERMTPKNAMDVIHECGMILAKVAEKSGPE
jgi:hypothetical protein